MTTNNDEETVNFPLSDEEYKTRKEELKKLVDEAYKSVQKATNFADKYHLSFNWDLAYGMGGFYQGDPDECDEYGDDGWYPSSSGNLKPRHNNKSCQTIKKKKNDVEQQMQELINKLNKAYDEALKFSRENEINFVFDNMSDSWILPDEEMDWYSSYEDDDEEDD